MTVDPLLLAVGRELYELRRDRGWTRGRVTTLLHRLRGTSLSERAIGTYETAQRVMPLKTFFDLCAIYEVSPAAVVAAALRRAAVPCPGCSRPL